VARRERGFRGSQRALPFSVAHHLLDAGLSLVVVDAVDCHRPSLQLVLDPSTVKSTQL
jgi:hypothetical protein